MTKIQCKVGDLRKVCELVACQGRIGKGTGYLVEDMLLLAKGDRLKVKAVDKHIQAYYVDLSYKVNVLEEGNIPVRDLEEFVNYLKTFGVSDTIILEAPEGEGKLRIERMSPRKVATLPTASKEHIISWKGGKSFSENLIKEGDSYKTGKGTTFGCKVDLDVSFLKTVLSDAEVVNQNIFPVEAKSPKTFIAKVGEETGGSIESEIPVEKVVGEMNSSYSFGFDGLFKTLEGKIRIHFMTKGPLVVEKKEEKYDVLYFLAPNILETIKEGK